MDQVTGNDIKLIDSAIALLKLSREEHVALVGALQRVQKIVEIATIAAEEPRRGRPKGSRNKKNGAPRPLTEEAVAAT